MKNIKKFDFYAIPQFYYPSGNLHVGHFRTFTVCDVVARYKKLKGFNILQCIGSDSFGLPAENAAIENGIHPKKWTYENINAMNEDIKKLSIAYDWNYTLNTCDDDYIKFEQQIFIDFFKKGLIYEAESVVNWDPVDNTVLSNEQVVNGRGWRSGAIVEQKKMKQWFMKITHYAEELLNDLKALDWPEKIKKMQENWIGKSDGCEIDFEISKNENAKEFDKYLKQKITIFTTRPETIYGVSSVAISFDHEIALELAKLDEDVKNFIQECKIGSVAEEDLAKREKKGIYTKLFVKNAINGEEIPLVITNYVLMNYGTGAVMMVPAHDERDFECVKKCFPELDVNLIIDSSFGKQPSRFSAVEINKICDVSHGILKDSPLINDLHSKNDKEKIIDILIKNKGEFIRRKTTYKLHDWCISRQRYWGCPIPVIHCDRCGIVLEKKENLPVLLPDDDLLTFGKENPLEKHPKWKFTKCPNCKNDATRDCNTMDTYVESSWYFLRYLAKRSNDKIFDRKQIEETLPVDFYTGGPEHATTHMLYARFFCKALRDCGYFESFKGDKKCEPFKKFMSIGMVCHKTFKDENGKYLYPDEVYLKEGKFYKISDNSLVEDGSSIKMSKSKKNVVKPSEAIEKYGIDCCRFFLMSDNPVDNDFDWNPAGLDATSKYIKKISNFFSSLNFEKNLEIETSSEIINKANNLINLYIDNFEKYQYNVSNAKFREMVSLIVDNLDKMNSNFLKQITKDLLILINPIMPDFSENLFKQLNFGDIYNAENVEIWPSKKEDLNNFVKVSVQIDNKFRGFLNLKEGEVYKQEDVLNLIKQNTNFAKYLENKEIKKFVYIENKFVNILLS